MPKGQKTIIWDSTNDSKLLRALLLLGDVKVDKDLAERIGAEMGDGVPGSAISLRLQRLRSMAKKGDTADAAAPTTPTKKRTAAASSSSTPRKRAKTVGVKKEQSNTEMDVHTSPVAETPARALDSVGKRMSKPTFKKVEKNFSIFEDGEDTADSKGHSVSDHDSDNSEYVNGSVVTDDGVTNDSVA